MNIMSDKAYGSAEEFIKGFFASLFKDIGFMSDKALSENIARLGSKGFAPEERTLGRELADNLLKNSGTVMLELVSDKRFRDLFKAAAGTELNLDSKDAGFVKAVRKKMAMGGRPVRYSGTALIDLDAYDQEAAAKTADIVTESIEDMKRRHDDYGDLIGALTKDDRIDIAFAASNFAYIIRAFSQNPIFRDDVTNIIDAVNSKTNAG